MGVWRVLAWLCASTFGAATAMAQTSTNLNLTLTTKNGGNTSSNTYILAQTGSAGSLGNAALVMTSSSQPIGDSGLSGPVQVTFKLAFNEVDTLAISFTESDPNFAFPTTVTMSGGTITGGTGAYAGATGSLDLTIVKQSAGALWSTSTTSGSGIVTVGGATMPLSLTNFRGWCCGWATREEDYYSTSMTVSGNLGNGTGTLVAYYYLNAPMSLIGTMTLVFNNADSLIIWYTYVPPSSSSISAPASFNGFALGGTGQYANAFGLVTIKSTNSGYSVSGTITPSPGASITQVKTIYGLPQVAFNTWIEIHGQNLVPADTPASGVYWSDAPDFANGRMPTQLGPISVSFNGTLGYVYWYCSAATDPNCADDQINVLAPLLSIADAGAAGVEVENNGSPVAFSVSFRSGYSPAFLSFDAVGHVAARHLDSSLMAPATLYPGLSTPAKAGETISLYGAGFGTVAGIVAGSATQSGDLQTLSCWVSGLNAQAVGALVSPGLYQINLTVPNGVPSGDNPVVCIYGFYSTFPGALIAIQ